MHPSWVNLATNSIYSPYDRTVVAADILSATANDLKPGEYQLRWQVLAVDGHITRGEIPFTVR